MIFPRLGELPPGKKQFRIVVCVSVYRFNRFRRQQVATTVLEDDGQS